MYVCMCVCVCVLVRLTNDVRCVSAAPDSTSGTASQFSSIPASKKKLNRYLSHTNCTIVS